MKQIPLTTQLHDRLKTFLAPADVVIDATAGNGFDTLFLAQQVGEHGLVYAFDVQAQAIEMSRQRLTQTGIEQRVKWVCSGHENMKTCIDVNLHGKVKLVVFNLGYLPGSDKRIKTTPETTLTALQQAFDILIPGGAISVIAYTGHDKGEEESQRVKDWFDRQKDGKHVLLIPESRLKNAPQWHWFIK